MPNRREFAVSYQARVSMQASVTKRAAVGVDALQLMTGAPRTKPMVNDARATRSNAENGKTDQQAIHTADYDGALGRTQKLLWSLRTGVEVRRSVIIPLGETFGRIPSVNRHEKRP